MVRFSLVIVLIASGMALVGQRRALADFSQSHLEQGLDPAAAREWLKDIEKRRKGVLISTSYRCQTACRCSGRLLKKKTTDYVVCADSSDEASQIEAAQAACKSSCVLEGKAEPTSPHCHPLDTQCKKAHCP